jgi:hypothetical protein
MGDNDQTVGWTAEELQELEDRPVTPDRREDFTDEQFERRLSMAKKLWASLAYQDPNMSAWAREIYSIVPPWAVYTSLDDGEGLVRRVYGVCLTEHENDTKYGAYVVSAVPTANSYTDGSLPLSEIAHRRIRRVMAARVAHTATPGLFIDPLGFYDFMLDRTQ